MNILMVGPASESKGGIATVIENFKKHYRGNPVFYLDSWKEGQRINVLFNSVSTINTKINEEQIDIVHFHVAQKGSFYRKALLANRVKKSAKIIFHMHASQFDTFYEESTPLVKQYIRKTLDKIDGLVVLSEEWARFYETLTCTPITIIENAVEIPKKGDYNSQSTTIVTLGRIGKRKGSYDILQLAKKIHPLYPDIQFILYGDGEVEKVKQLIREEEIVNVSLGGWIEKEEQEVVLKASLLHLLPSYQEGLPMSILESMSYGIPNLTSNVGGIPQVLRDGENGLMVDPGDSESLFEKLFIFLQNEEIRKIYSQNAYQMIETNFSIDSYFVKWNHFYTNIFEYKDKHI